ncbi:translation initiation factor IF-2 N-terminal domain-containing protein, partial [Clostridium perfringens]|uniref:translation initiation factor IF-2 N-terminal domain-containing protein n=1 Tax=Clostridium perfringens TaxID=1502 RepID=UPI0022458AC3
MAKRVYELASLLGTTNDQMIEILNSNGIEVSDYTDLVDNKLEEKIRKDVLPNYNFVSHDNKSSLKSINIIGLFNKKNYKITFKDDINLFIAENGFGKTTILNIIVAVLKGDKKKLKTLPFKKIIVNFNVESIEISKEEFYENKLSKVKTRRLLKKLEYKLPNHMFERVYDEFITNGNIDIINLRRLLKENTHRYTKYSEFDSIYDYDDMEELIWHLKKYSYLNNDNKLNEKLSKIKNLAKEEILYFPTYRRIEEELDNFISASILDKRRFNDSTINFGMDDVEKVITGLTDKLKEDAIHNYSIMNGEILDDLLTDKLITNDREKVEINNEIMKIIIGRIGKDKIQQLDKLMDFVNNKSDVANKTFLEYYLYKLINIYENQKPIDEKIKKYKDVCNEYLVNKEIVYDEVITEVSIRDKDNGEKIS